MNSTNPDAVMLLLKRFLQDPDDLPVFGFDTYQVAVMFGYLTKDVKRGSAAAKLATDRVRALIKSKKLKGLKINGEWRVFTPAIAEVAYSYTDPSTGETRSLRSAA
ncbi:hypothetical protein [Kutzneria albida]|uniref:Uncharacterized protein n=1 Tax=Kutzneria albida DSM 43870 TaxID=1449976 RepID=W5WAR2_9PSEU|nr:hypothetical protein [Kutzneria albida]AHH98208.1 hypothetical protein KALB_4846 [Kutzneria albida DSM 43870]